MKCIHIISSHSSRVFLNNFYRIDINKKKELEKVMLQLCRIACSRHGCISLSPAFDRYTSRRYRCARAQLNKFPSWSQFWIQKSQNILKNCLKACWTTFSPKVLSTLNFLAYFFHWSWNMRILPHATVIIKIINKMRIFLCWT